MVEGIHSDASLFPFRFPIPQKTQSVDFNLPVAVSSIRVAFYTPCFICFTAILC